MFIQMTHKIFDLYQLHISKFEKFLYISLITYGAKQKTVNLTQSHHQTLKGTTIVFRVQDTSNEKLFSSTPLVSRPLTSPRPYHVVFSVSQTALFSRCPNDKTLRHRPPRSRLIPEDISRNWRTELVGNVRHNSELGRKRNYQKFACVCKVRLCRCRFWIVVCVVVMLLQFQAVLYIVKTVFSH